MKIFRPGFAVVSDEPADAPEVKEANPLPGVAEAMALAAQRQTQVLEYTRHTTGPTPLVNGDEPKQPAKVLPPTADPLLDLTSSGSDSERDPQDVELERLRAIVAAMEARKPHSVNQHQEVQK